MWPSCTSPSAPPGNRLELLRGDRAGQHADGSLYAIDDMPISVPGSGRVKREVDAAGLLLLQRPIAGQVAFSFVERVAARPGEGVGSMFGLGHSTAVVDGVLDALGIPHAAVPAATWKRSVGLPVHKALAVASTPLTAWKSTPFAGANSNNAAIEHALTRAARLVAPRCAFPGPAAAVHACPPSRA